MEGKNKGGISCPQPLRTQFYFDKGVTWTVLRRGVMVT